MELRVRIEVSGPLLAGKGPAIVQQHIERFVDLAVSLLVREVKIRTPRGASPAGSGLAYSIKEDVQGRGTPLVRGIVGTASKYGEVIERGRRPGRGWPPKGVLLEWIRYRFGVTDQKTLERLEFLIRRKIGQKGFEGVHMFEKALTENFNRLQAMAQREGLALVAVLDGQ